ncbi:MAG: PaaI family thioesterase, partial [Pseudomonadota bacterium]|nr:PaaI family thioesterase [Pseudomonadota bacterium]
MDVNDIVESLNAHSPAAVKKLGGRVHSYDESAGLLEMRFDIDGSYCHSGDIVQGGFVAGMLDAAMAHVVFASEQEFVVVATLEINVSYLEMAKPGELRAIGRIVKLGKSIG